MPGSLQTASGGQGTLPGTDEVPLLVLLGHFKGAAVYVGSTPAVATPMTSLKFGRRGDFHAHPHEDAFPPAAAHSETLVAMGFWDLEGGSFWGLVQRQCSLPWPLGFWRLRSAERLGIPSADRGFPSHR